MNLSSLRRESWISWKTKRKISLRRNFSTIFQSQISYSGSCSIKNRGKNSSGISCTRNKDSFQGFARRYNLRTNYTQVQNLMSKRWSMCKTKVWPFKSTSKILALNRYYNGSGIIVFCCQLVIVWSIQRFFLKS